MSKFLEDLKNAADKGEFNSEAAKKINEITEAADGKSNQMTTDELENSLKNKMDATPVEPVSEDQISELNSEYEKKMAAIKEVDAANNQLAILSEIEEMVRLSIEDMLEHVSNLETNIGEKLDTEAIYADLKVKIETIKSEYKS